MITHRKFIKYLSSLFFLWGSTNLCISQGLQTEGNVSFVLEGNVNIVVNGDFEIDPGEVNFQDNTGSRLHLSGELLTGGADLNLNGGLVIKGTSKQTISNNMVLGGLIVENPLGLELNGTIEVLNTLNLFNGYIITDLNELTISESTQINVENESSYVHGPINVRTNASYGSKTLFFPIGVDQDYRPVTLEFQQPQSLSNTYSAAVYNNNLPDRTSESSIKSISEEVYWALSSSEYNLQEGKITLYVTSDDLITLDSATIIKDDGSNWINIGGAGLTSIPGEISSTKSFSDLGYFALAEAIPPPPYTQVIPDEFYTIDLNSVSIEFDSIELINLSTVKYQYEMLSSSGNYQEITPIQNGNLFAIDLEGHMFDGLGIISHFEFSTNSGIDVWTDSKTTYLRYGGDGINFPTHPSGYGNQVTNYKIVAIPLDLNSGNVSSVFVDDFGPIDNTKWRLWHYMNDNVQNVELTSSGSIERGKGYWLIVKDPTTIDTGEGTTSLHNDDMFKIPLSEGLNQIGNPYNFRLEWQDVQNQNCSDIELIGYRKGQINYMTYLDAFEGGFVDYNSGMGFNDLTIPYKKNVASTCRVTEGPKVKYPINADNWLVNLKLVSGEMGNGLGGFGMHPDASIKRDYYDKSAFPRFIYYLEAVFKHDNDRITRDIIPTAESHIWEFEVNTNMNSEFTILEWDNTNFGNNDKELYLFNVSSQKIINMREQMNYRYKTVPTTGFQIHYGYREDIEQNLLPSRISIGPGYPNPATNHVTLPFTLPERESLYNISIVIYDLLGNEIKSLVTKQLDGGFHETVWDLHDSRGTIPSGVYIAQLKVVINGKHNNLNSKIIIR